MNVFRTMCSNVTHSTKPNIKGLEVLPNAFGGVT